MSVSMGMGDFDSQYLDAAESQPGATDLIHVKPVVVTTMNKVAKSYFEQTGNKLIITGGAEQGFHPGKGEFSHENGWKLDISTSDSSGGPTNAQVLGALFDKEGVAAAREDSAHFDVCFGASTPGGYSSNPITQASQGSLSGDVDSRSNTLGNKILEAAEKYIGAPWIDEDNVKEGYFSSAKLVSVAYEEGGEIADTPEKSAARNYMFFAQSDNGYIFDNPDYVIGGDIVYFIDEGNDDTYNDCHVVGCGLCYDNGSIIISLKSLDGVQKSSSYKNVSETADGDAPKASFKYKFGRSKKSPFTPGQKPGKQMTNSPQSGYHGFIITPVGMACKGVPLLRLTKLPIKKNFAEPIYPDLITVQGEIPKWALDETSDNIKMMKEDGLAGKPASDGNPPEYAQEQAPNGLHYKEADIQSVMNDPTKTDNRKPDREGALKILAKEPVYCHPVEKKDDGTLVYKTPSSEETQRLTQNVNNASDDHSSDNNSPKSETKDLGKQVKEEAIKTVEQQAQQKAAEYTKNGIPIRH